MEIGYLGAFLLIYTAVDIFFSRKKNKQMLVVEKEHNNKLIIIKKESYRLNKLNTKLIAEQNLLIELANGINHKTVDMRVINLESELKNEIANENYERCETILKEINKIRNEK